MFQGRTGHEQVWPRHADRGRYRECAFARSIKLWVGRLMHNESESLVGVSGMKKAQPKTWGDLDRGAMRKATGHKRKLMATNSRPRFTALLLATIAMCGCGSPSSLPTITEYSLLRLADGSWLPLNPTSYSVDVSNQRVIRETAGSVARSEKCAVKDIDNWECSEDNGRWLFGFRNGTFWEVNPSSMPKQEARHVSAMKWWLVNIGGMFE